MTVMRVIKSLTSISLLGLFFYSTGAWAQATTTNNIGQLAANIQTSLGDLAKLVTAVAYVAGMGFALASILKFKAHKDNPTQIPVGTPIALLFVAAALLFLPNLFNVAGKTIFGSSATAAGISGTTGVS